MKKREVELFGQILQSPLIAASGTFGYGVDQQGSANYGAITIKSLTVSPRAGNPPPRIAEVRREEIVECYYPVGQLEDSLGFVNSIGLQNAGIDVFLAQYAPRCRESQAKFIASIAGERTEEYVQLVEKLQQCQDFLIAIEVNISCPNVEHGLVFGTDPELTFALVSALKRISKIPLLVKLTPNTEDICVIAQSAILAGADGLSLINTIKATAKTKDGRALSGGLSGPIIRPIAKRLIKEVCGAFGDRVPIITGGGVWNAQDVVEILAFGAWAVSIGTLNFTSSYNISRLLFSE